MKNLILLTIILVVGFAIVSNAEECKISHSILAKVNGRTEVMETTKTLHYKVFYNNYEAMQYAKEHGILDNIITDRDNGRFLVFDFLPDTVFVCAGL